MQQVITLQVTPAEAENPEHLSAYIAATVSAKRTAVSGFHILKKSIDARGRQVRINLTLRAFINEPFHDRTVQQISYPDVSRADEQVIVVGAGPCGLFAALRLIENGIRPVILERGKDVRARRRDLAMLNKEGIVNGESNYCFGEGGAGTYSDGKLYTRSNKRGSIDRILNLFVQFGADERILYEAHPHIGTNKLPQIITEMRQQITNSGGIFLFEQKVTALEIEGDRVTGVLTAAGNRFTGSAVVLATGHSARDIFELLHRQNVLIHAKPFALGVRIEHPQQLIDSIQYHSPARNEHLPPASYSLVQQVNGTGVFSFCMCPGGIIAPAATSEGELVVNGWSPSKRNNPFANSGMVVSVEEKDYGATDGPLAAMRFQQQVEQKAFQAGGGKFVAPALRMTDFVNRRLSADLPLCSYLPGLASAPLWEVLPQFVYKSLAEAFKMFGQKMRGYYSADAVVVATESRTSSPVRIPRDPETLEHPQVKGLYPAGEGAGYAGGIVSAAMDGEKIAGVIVDYLNGRSFIKKM
ncbi:NAD(P)/FAD-dependent oxidoreductase [Flavihumibacter solisilvae]|uniref:FAD-binding protein n=1 Tax=Flavihumibacter solisilvae TaxID=1349421 RepID=A0A0C1IJZ8_9BACT|nr:FAD-dependent oxidoreductase [Flavihumibacter solisilvae]KIC90774.1 FAD-binding protein [Flavihumibacter solisilvae]